MNSAPVSFQHLWSGQLNGKHLTLSKHPEDPLIVFFTLEDAFQVVVSGGLTLNPIFLTHPSELVPSLLREISETYNGINTQLYNQHLETGGKVH